MIVKSENAKKREFKGVEFEVLSTGEKSMMKYKKGDNVPFHSHPNEQCGYVLSGEHIIRINDTTEILRAGDTYAIPENVEHAWEVIEAGEAVDVFTPPRYDYM